MATLGRQLALVAAVGGALSLAAGCVNRLSYQEPTDGVTVPVRLAIVPDQRFSAAVRSYSNANCDDETTWGHLINPAFGMAPRAPQEPNRLSIPGWNHSRTGAVEVAVAANRMHYFLFHANMVDLGDFVDCGVMVATSFTVGYAYELQMRFGARDRCFVDVTTYDMATREHVDTKTFSNRVTAFGPQCEQKFRQFRWL